MTLSFGIDPKQKTLMFATEDPYHLNDCQDIDPNLPLERQEYVGISPSSLVHAPNLSFCRWYHGGISKAEAEHILRRNEEGSYIVRNVDLHRQEFSLILK